MAGWPEGPVSLSLSKSRRDNVDRGSIQPCVCVKAAKADKCRNSVRIPYQPCCARRMGCVQGLLNRGTQAERGTEGKDPAVGSAASEGLRMGPCPLT